MAVRALPFQESAPTNESSAVYREVSLKLSFSTRKKSRKLTGRLRELEKEIGRAFLLYGNLSDPEKKIAEKAAEGLSNKQIASHYGISVSTVKHRLSNIYNSLFINSDGKRSVLGMVFLAVNSVSLSAPQAEANRDKQTFSGLTPREREVSELVALGLENKDIGGSLRISDQTVKHHVQKIFEKLGIRAGHNRVKVSNIYFGLYRSNLEIAVIPNPSTPAKADLLRPFGWWKNFRGWKEALYYVGVAFWEELVFRWGGFIMLPAALTAQGWDPRVALAVGALWSGPIFISLHPLIRCLVNDHTHYWDGWAKKLNRGVSVELLVLTGINMLLFFFLKSSAALLFSFLLHFCFDYFGPNPRAREWFIPTPRSQEILSSSFRPSGDNLDLMLAAGIYAHGGPMSVSLATLLLSYLIESITTMENSNRTEALKKITHSLVELCESFEFDLILKAKQFDPRWHGQMDRKNSPVEELKRNDYQQWLIKHAYTYQSLISLLEQLPPRAGNPSDAIGSAIQIARRQIINSEALLAFISGDFVSGMEPIVLQEWLSRRDWGTKGQAYPVETLLGNQDIKPVLALPGLLHIAIERIVSNGFHANERANWWNRARAILILARQAEEGSAAEIDIVSPGRLNISPEKLLVPRYEGNTFSSGLGLSFARRALEKMGATIQLRNRITHRWGFIEKWAQQYLYEWPTGFLNHVFFRILFIVTGVLEEVVVTIRIPTISVPSAHSTLSAA